MVLTEWGAKVTRLRTAPGGIRARGRENLFWGVIPLLLTIKAADLDVPYRRAAEESDRFRLTLTQVARGPRRS